MEVRTVLALAAAAAASLISGQISSTAKTAEVCYDSDRESCSERLEASE